MRLMLLAFMALISTSGAQLFAQTYPNKPVKLVVPFAPGGIADAVGRALGERLEAQLGQPIIIENRSGGGSQVGTASVATAAPDGYTLMVVDPSVVVHPTLQESAPYRVEQLTSLATLTTAPLMVVVNPTVPAHTLRELVDYSKKVPGGVTYASPGIGTTPHLAPELLKIQTGFNALHIPYRGGGPSIPDLISGRVQTAFYSNATVLPLINDKSLRAIAQTGRRRVPSAPDVPTAVESGFPEFVVELWTAIFGPAGLPDEVKERLGREIKKAVESEEFNSRISNLGVEAFYKDATAADQFVRAEYERWGALIKAAKIVAK